MKYSMHDRLEFGKYKGRTIQEVSQDDTSYLRWALNNVNQFELSEEDAEYIMDAADVEDEMWYEEYPTINETLD